MYVTERQIQILSRIIELYNETGEPVSSKMLANDLGKYSSATLRNEMAELEAIGLLKQPHTSSGRLPTYLGYRMYIDNILSTKNLKKVEKNAINTLLKVSNLNPQNFLEVAGDVLASMTNCVTVATFPTKSDTITIEAIEFILLNQKTVVATIVFSTAFVTNKVLRLDVAVSSDDLQSFCSIVNEEIQKKPLSDVNATFLENLMLTLGTYGMVLSPLIDAIEELCNEVIDNEIIVQGSNNLFKFSDIEFKIDNVFNVLSNKNTIYKILDVDTNSTNIIIGEETCIDAIKGASIITTNYRFKEYKGTIAAIGPMRLDYGKVIPHIEYIADVVGKTFEDILKDD